jgi:hypothetical protein
MCHQPVNSDHKQLVNPQRAPVPILVLWSWVDGEVLAQVNAQNTFTAYSITKLLRAQHPDHEIPHAYVQARVHYIMEIVHHYAMTWEMWNGEPARTYAPLVVVSNPSPVTLNALEERPALAPRSVRIDWEDHD